MVRVKKEAWAGAIGGREELHQTKREAILRMAARMFAAEGYAGTSLASIAERLNVAKPTLYYYVKSKEEILNACVDAGLVAVKANLKQAHSAGSDGYEKLAIYFRLHVDFILDDFGVLLAAARQELAPKHRKALKSVDRAVIEIIKEGIADRSIKRCDPKIACFALFGVFNGIPSWFRDGEELTRSDVATAYFDMLFDGFGNI